jgi:emp24/gp25L/p24 family/GOLD
MHATVADIRFSLLSSSAPAESTNERVAKFAWFTIFGLLALGVWQVIHLRDFFKRKYLID